MDVLDRCRCGAGYTLTGCEHCDRAPACKNNCTQCETYNLHCPICLTKHKNQYNTNQCEVRCRRWEQFEK